MNLLRHSWYMTVRHLRGLQRQPWWIAISLAQPITYLVLYGQLFKRIVELPGFQATNYVTFVTPGIVIMMSIFGGGWNGMGIIMDIDNGVMDRFLVSPASRFAILAGRLIQMSMILVVQTAILMTLGILLGARFEGGLVGFLVLIASGVLLAVPFGALSNAMGLVLRRTESVIGASNFILLPMIFLSPVFMAPALMPGWMQSVARFNPVAWAVGAARSAMSVQPDWGAITLDLALLTILTVFSSWVATQAFRSYQRSA
jgi:ABC-2 type transport system permease protein